MTKTEQKLLEMAAKNGRGCVTTAYGRGLQGGRISGGKRDRDAMFKLQSKGLITIVARDPWSEYNRGRMQSGTSFVFELV